MAKSKSVDATWSDMKAEIAKLDTRQLVSLLADLYRFSKENQAFLNARFAVVADPFDPYKRIIAECMYPDVYKNKPVRISKAKKAISDYSKAVGDSLGEAELMTFFVEQGNAFTIEFGDIDEEFYDALLRMYRRAIEKIPSLPEERRGELKARLRTIMTSSVDIGWGYHDALCEEYYSAFPDDEESPNQ